jgi:hypothetical protein
MQDRYAGDVGDFGKFGLLRHLVNGTNHRLGVIWYLYPNESHNEDGKFTKYLSNRQFELCDVDLYGKLRTVVANRRCTAALEESGLFLCYAVYFSKHVDFYSAYPGQTQTNKAKRLHLRSEWLIEALSFLSTSNVLFLDPDNGLEVDSCKSMNQKKSGKFAYYEEIKRLHEGRSFTIVYHHLNRHRNHGTHQEQIRNRAEELRTRVSSAYAVHCLRYKPYSPRAFFILTEKSSNGEVSDKLSSFRESPWGAYWDTHYVCA